MAQFPLQIRFRDEQTARMSFHVFPPDNLPYLDHWARKRSGDSQYMLLRLRRESDINTFIALCRAHPDILEVLYITEAEFTAAPSNAV
jgi:hypothetical protein